MQKIISCRVTDEYVQGTGAVVGAVGSHNDAALELSFSEIWDGTTKRIVWYDALGQNPTLTILTVDLLVPGEAEVYRVPIPAEAKTVAGNLMMTIRGVVIGDDGLEEKAVVSATATFVVLDSVWDDEASESEDITPSQAEQLQAEIDDIKLDISETIEALKKLDDYVEATGNYASAAEGSAAHAEQNAADAEESAAQAGTYAKNAAESAEEAKNAATAAGGVSSVNGKTGAVELAAKDVGAVAADGSVPMTGNLLLDKATSPTLQLRDTTNKSGAQIQHSNHITALRGYDVIGDISNYRGLMLRDATQIAALKYALQLVDAVDGVTTYYRIYGEHNKPAAAEVGAMEAIAEYKGDIDTSTATAFVVQVNSSVNAELWAALGSGTNSWAHIINGAFYQAVDSAKPRMQIAVGRNGRIAARAHDGSAWLPWVGQASTDYAVKRGGDTMTGVLSFKPVDNGAQRSVIYKNANADADYGIAVADYDADGDYMSLSLCALYEKALLNINGTIYTLLHTGNKSLISPADIGAARIATGSYVGTGTYGADNPNSLTFDFVPKYLGIYERTKGYHLRYTNEVCLAFRYGTVSSVASTLTASPGKTFTWYYPINSPSDAMDIQLNAEGYTYYYYAIG